MKRMTGALFETIRSAGPPRRGVCPGPDAVAPVNPSSQGSCCAQLVAAVRAIADPQGPVNGGPRRALVNSFGAGGNFFAAVLEPAS